MLNNVDIQFHSFAALSPLSHPRREMVLFSKSSITPVAMSSLQMIHHIRYLGPDEHPHNLGRVFHIPHVQFRYVGRFRYLRSQSTPMNLGWQSEKREENLNKIFDTQFELFYNYLFLFLINYFTNLPYPMEP